jgi:HPt (histidine-containing phosphotransfer) domain-containing protein
MSTSLPTPPPTPQPSAIPFYLDTHLALSQIGDLETMNTMLLMLQESLQRDVPHIVTLLQEGDLVSANRLLHSLKGFIPIFCPEALCALVVQVEGQSKQGLAADLLPAYANLRPELERLLAEVTEYLLAHHVVG